MINTTKLEKALEIQELLLKKIENHLIKISKYKKEKDYLFNKLLLFRKNNRYNIWFSILSYLLSFLLLHYLKHYISLNEVIDILLKIIIYLFPHINCYYQMNEYFNNYEEYKKLEKKYSIVDQELFAEKFFLRNDKVKYEDNKFNIFILRKELGNSFKNDNINIILDNKKELIKNLH